MSTDRHEPRPALRSRFWVEAALAVASAALLVLTLLWYDWVELILGVQPDRGDGSLEWLLLVVLLVATSANSALARREWRRTRLVRLTRPQVASR